MTSKTPREASPEATLASSPKPRPRGRHLHHTLAAMLIGHSREHDGSPELSGWDHRPEGPGHEGSAYSPADPE